MKGHKLLSVGAEVEGEVTSGVKVVLRRPAITLLVILGGLTESFGLGGEALLEKRRKRTKALISVC